MAADCLSEEKPNPKLSEFTVMIGDTNAFELVMSQLSTFEFTEEDMGKETLSWVWSWTLQNLNSLPK